MRLGLRITALLISCCILVNQGCTPERASDDRARSDAKEGTNSSGTTVPVVPEVEVPVVVPVNPFTPPPPAGGGGGGSQGAIRPERTGNPDASGGARCGNNIQEARGRAGSCQYDIYGTTFTSLTGPSSLVGFNINDGGASTFSQVIDLPGVGCEVQAVSAIEFSPDGTLYAVGAVACTTLPPTSTINLLTLDCQTGVPTIIGPLGIEAGEDSAYISDLDFDSHGRLYAYLRTIGGVDPDQLGTINIATGDYTAIGNTGLDAEGGNGLATLSFPQPDSLFQAAQTLNRLNVNTGAVQVPYGAINFPAAGDNPRVRAMDRDAVRNAIYVNFQYGPPLDPTVSYLGVLDRDTNTVNYLRPANPVAAPSDLRGITVNRLNEECDGPNFDLPPGTVCSSTCTLLEALCSDLVPTTPFPGIDNDFDGLANCDDPDCFAQACNDLSGCTTGETCVAAGEGAFRCAGGVQTVCQDGNECTQDICTSLPVFPFDQFACEQDFQAGAICTPDANCTTRNPDGSCVDGSVIDLCLAGLCTATGPVVCNIDADCAGAPGVCGEGNVCICEGDANCPSGSACADGTCVVTNECQAANLGVIPAAQDGCDDGNPCTADGCIVADVNGILGPICSNGAIDNELVLCIDNDNECQVGRCIEGNCDMTNPFIIPDLCLEDADCGPNSDCLGATVSALGVCAASLGVNCTVSTDCPLLAGGILDVCINLGIPVPGVCSCNDGDSCSSDTCVAGQCTPIAAGIAFPCLADFMCGPGGDCAISDGDLIGQCACASDADCPIATFCGPEGTCLLASIAVDGTACDSDGVACTVEECVDGVCVPDVTPPIDISICGEPTLCSEPICTAAGCDIDLFDGSVSCQTLDGDDNCVLGVAVCINGVATIEGCVALDPPVLCPTTK